MYRIVIVDGVYGHCPEGQSYINPVFPGETCEVSEEEAARLIKLGVAESLGEAVNEAEILPGPAPDTAPQTMNKDDLMELTRDQLTDMARDMGISPARTKSEIADQIIAADEDTPADGPELGAEDPVV